MINRLIDDINKALDAEAYMAALALALTLPDICAKAEYGDTLRNKERYIKWFDEYIGKYEICPREEGEECMPYLSGEVVYSLRNNVLHQGNPNIDNTKIKEEVNKIDKFSLVIEKKNKFDIYADASSLTKDLTSIQPKEVRSYRVNVRRLCFIISSVAKNMYAKNKDKFNFFNFEIIDWDKEKEENPIISNINKAHKEGNINE